ncbi:MAG: AhpC/TSA family protein [Bacteroidetes bacterium]|nr:AhpC/TSA family protein [Bacteroidota bacterium]NCQ10959.1 AhpC/TSA family protein [Bacteroidota bacterium]
MCMTICCLCNVKNTNAQVAEKAEDINPLLIGESVPEAYLQDKDGKTILLQDVLKLKQTVLIFYRGGWCPYCNLQLSGLIKIEKDVVELGYQIVAISPDDYKNLKSTYEKDSMNYQLFSDSDAKFIKAIGIGFKTPTMLKVYISSKGQKGKTSEVMPVPTVLVLDENGKILFEYINTNYKERISGELLLAVLKTLNK